MLASAPRRQGGGAAHEVGRKRAPEAAEEESAAALRVTEQKEVGEQPVGDHGVHGVQAWNPTRAASLRGFAPSWREKLNLIRLTISVIPPPHRTGSHVYAGPVICARPEVI